MKKEITAQQFKDLPRATKRALQRDLHKKGLKTPVIRERVSVAVLVDKELYLKALKILESAI